MKRVLRAFLLSLLVTILICSPVFAIAYSATITVANTSGSDYANLPILVPMNNNLIASSGYSSPDMLDTYITDTEGNVLPFMPADDKSLFVVPDLDDDTTGNFIWISGQDSKGSHDIVTGYGGKITTPDNADLEPGDNFQLEISLYIPDVSCTIFDKLNALRIDYNATTDVLTLTVGTYATPDYTLTATGVTSGLHTISLNISHTAGEDSLFLRPTGVGDYETFSKEYPTNKAHWEILKDNATVGSLMLTGPPAVYVDDYVSGEGADLYAFTNPNVSFGSIIPHIYGVVNYPYSEWGLIIKMPGQAEWRSTGKDPYYFGGGSDPWEWYVGDDYLNPIYTNPITGLAWTQADLTDIQFGFWFDRYSGSDYFVGFAIELVDAAYQPTLNLFVDSVLKDSENITEPIPDNTNDWIWYPNPYFNYIKLETSN